MQGKALCCSGGRTPAAMSMPETAVALDFALMSACEAPVRDPRRQLVIKLAPVLTEGASASTTAAGSTSSPLTSAESAPATILSSRPPSTPVRLTLAVNILEGLITRLTNFFP